MKFSDAMHQQSAILYAVTWMPVDWPLSEKRLPTTYVAAHSLDEAAKRVSDNPLDIKRIVVCGGMIERQQPFHSLSRNEDTTAVRPK